MELVDTAGWIRRTKLAAYDESGAGAVRPLRKSGLWRGRARMVGAWMQLLPCPCFYDRQPACTWC